MNLEEIFQFLNFWINKYTNSWYTIPELTEVLDRGQLSYYSDNKAKYSTSQLVKEILSPFRERFNFTTSDTVSGVIPIPSNSEYLDLLDIQIQYTISDRTIYAGVPIIGEDERAIRLNSQVDPVTVTSPIAEILAPRFIKMWPTSGYTGTITYLRRPVKPVFVYTIISERVIVFDEAASTNIEWRQTEIIPVLSKALQHIGINLPDNAINEFAAAKTQNNFTGLNRL